jgi:hypothetical protein
MQKVTVQFTAAQLARLESAVSFLGRGVTLEKLIVSGALGRLDGWGNGRKQVRAMLREEIRLHAAGEAYAQPSDGIDLADGVQHSDNYPTAKAA